MEDFRDIKVMEGQNHRVQVRNPTAYPLIGLGDQGAVFLLGPGRCVKIFANAKEAGREAAAYRKCRRSPLLPRLFEYGPNYLVMEYVRGQPLDEYIKAKAGIPFSLSMQIVNAIKEMKRLGFKRLDVSMRHILVGSRNTLKVIDHVNSFALRSPKPSSLLRALRDMGLLETFLGHVKVIDRELYLKWADEPKEEK